MLAILSTKCAVRPFEKKSALSIKNVSNLAYKSNHYYHCITTKRVTSLRSLSPHHCFKPSVPETNALQLYQPGGVRASL